MSAAEWFVGQEVVLRQHLRGGYRDEIVTISRIGRKWVYIQRRSREEAFDITDGRVRGGNTWSSRIGTAEMFEAWDRHARAVGRLRENTRGYSWYRNLTAEQIDSISELIEAAR